MLRYPPKCLEVTLHPGNAIEVGTKGTHALDECTRSIGQELEPHVIELLNARVVGQVPTRLGAKVIRRTLKLPSTKTNRAHLLSQVEWNDKMRRLAC